MDYTETAKQQEMLEQLTAKVADIQSQLAQKGFVANGGGWLETRVKESNEFPARIAEMENRRDDTKMGLAIVLLKEQLTIEMTYSNQKINRESINLLMQLQDMIDGFNNSIVRNTADGEDWSAFPI